MRLKQYLTNENISMSNIEKIIRTITPKRRSYILPWTNNKESKEIYKKIEKDFNKKHSELEKDLSQDIKDGTITTKKSEEYKIEWFKNDFLYEYFSDLQQLADETEIELRYLLEEYEMRNPDTEYSDFIKTVDLLYEISKDMQKINKLEDFNNIELNRFDKYLDDGDLESWGVDSFEKMMNLFYALMVFIKNYKNSFK